ncbi:MAG: hypothetical protein WCB67_16365 [Solirubrobacteraceae bacterium]
MKRQALTALMRRWLTVVVSAGAVGLAAGCGSATSSSSHSASGGTGTSTSATTSASTTTSASSTGPSAGALTVTPARGGPTTQFSLRFIAPASSGSSAGSRVSFTLSLTGGSGNCIGPRTVAVPAATKGQPVTIAVAPASLGGTWCPGTHKARVVEVQGPVCNPGTMCPQYLRVVGTVGETTFSVSA